MKYLIFSAIILSGLALSCDGRKSKNEALKDSVEAFKESIVNLETISIRPHAYTEIRTDTITNFGFNIKIRNYSLMNNDLLLVKKDDSKNPITIYHRKFESEIEISYRSKDIFNIVINAEKFIHKSNNEFWSRATLQHVWVDIENSEMDEISLNLTFIDPSNFDYKYYSLVVSNQGDAKYNLLEQKVS